PCLRGRDLGQDRIAVLGLVRRSRGSHYRRLVPFLTQPIQRKPDLLVLVVVFHEERHFSFTHLDLQLAKCLALSDASPRTGAVILAFSCRSLPAAPGEPVPFQRPFSGTVQGLGQ